MSHYSRVSLPWASSLRTCLGAAAIFATSACDGLTGKEGDRPEGFRFIEGSLIVPEEDILGRQVTGLQVAAMHLGADGSVTPFPSAVFDPSVQRAEASFVITVPNDLDVLLVLQVPSASQRGVGSFLGLYRAGNDALAPRGEDDVDLGSLEVVRGARQPADTTLRGVSGVTPGAQTDTDGDGLNNDVDDDDDNDDVADFNDDDVAGDGVADALQDLSALADADGDGVPDVMK
jgi:hypothetical protein